jgi:hypothetical protein
VAHGMQARRLQPIGFGNGLSNTYTMVYRMSFTKPANSNGPAAVMVLTEETRQSLEHAYDLRELERRERCRRRYLRTANELYVAANVDQRTSKI